MFRTFTERHENIEDDKKFVLWSGRGSEEYQALSLASIRTASALGRGSAFRGTGPRRAASSHGPLGGSGAAAGSRAFAQAAAVILVARGRVSVCASRVSGLLAEILVL